MPAETTIAISEAVWRWLNSLKTGPEDSFDDVLKRLREESEWQPPDPPEPSEREDAEPLPDGGRAAGGETHSGGAAGCPRDECDSDGWPPDLLDRFDLSGCPACNEAWASVGAKKPVIH